MATEWPSSLRGGGGGDTEHLLGLERSRWGLSSRRRSAAWRTPRPPRMSPVTGVRRFESVDAFRAPSSLRPRARASLFPGFILCVCPAWNTWPPHAPERSSSFLLFLLVALWETGKGRGGDTGSTRSATTLSGFAINMARKTKDEEVCRDVRAPSRLRAPGLRGHSRSRTARGRVAVEQPGRL